MLFEFRNRSSLIQQPRVQCVSQNRHPLDAEEIMLLYTGNMVNTAQLPSRQYTMTEATS